MYQSGSLCCKYCPVGTYMTKTCNVSKGNSFCESCPVSMFYLLLLLKKKMQILLALYNFSWCYYALSIVCYDRRQNSQNCPMFLLLFLMLLLLLLFFRRSSVDARLSLPSLQTILSWLLNFIQVTWGCILASLCCWGRIGGGGKGGGGSPGLLYT